ncbi:DUF554 domain-containing protein [Clostridium grantii]|uniref:DUF554 domain-containing protein n=1 Tax=Clostridium grantii DSM 8605 TaxID=1121316 RepID=A0A1M5V8D6_9CLOT|nr:DUF554 domain-containing protein [Clostridium grantii]SHH71529.1 hypothetical protein SAMN02745207_02172 [Clostridium grantii DSM 8605]
MLGTVVNFFAIILGSILGLFFRGGIPDRFNETMGKAIALSVLLVGILNAIKAENILLIIISLLLGAIIGEFLKIEENLEKLGNYLEKKFARKGNTIAEGFVTASLLFCIGSMAIVGSLESGLNNNHETLFAKSVLDGVSSIVFSSTLGLGVMLSAVPVLLYQGLITLSASLIKEFLVPSVITDMSAVGGLLIIALGLNMLEIKKIKVGNLLPSVFIPLIYYMISLLF